MSEDYWLEPGNSSNNSHSGSFVIGKVSCDVPGNKTTARVNNFELTCRASKKIAENSNQDDAIFSIPNAFAVKADEEINNNIKKTRGK